MGGGLSTQGHWFIDSEGRKVLLRGVNLGGSSKVPRVPNGATHIPTDYHDHRGVSFVGRPFPLKEADEHYNRLRHWGFNCLRFLTTWEAIEHAGPGMYDEDYLDYLYQVVKKAGDYGFYVFIDPHMDMWSRMTGGDGAPGWTLEMAGFDLSRLDASDAAITMAARYPNYAKMSWGNNTNRLGCATMYTLFYGGERFAPRLSVDGVNFQEYLQDHFVSSYVEVARRIAGLPHVIGYDCLNEPRPGYIGVDDLNSTPLMWVDGPLLTWFETMAIPTGVPSQVPYIHYDGLQPSETAIAVLNPDGFSAWVDPARDIWQMHGVWEKDGQGRGVLLQPGYFSGGNFFMDYVRPLIERLAFALRTVDRDALIFFQGEPGSFDPIAIDPRIPLVNASHWYDVLTLYRKHYDPSITLEWGTFRIVVGEGPVREMFKNQIGLMIELTDKYLRGAPALVGEFGLPYDLDDGYPIKTGDYACPIDALSAYYDALDAHLAHGTQWNYTPDNDNRWGDQWNQEDLSIFSRDQQDDPGDLDSGGRAVVGFCRPHLYACAGTPRRQFFNQDDGNFALEVEPDAQVQQPTTVYVPRIQYPRGFEVAVSSGVWEYNPGDQCLTWVKLSPGPQTLSIKRL
ncbi:MAG TPA: cellulase family glycosylhydrolase [Anaerolineaceae bacterium]|nr:cellulase family glycosylhydrolase [Anaerolineaceae bacterium]